MTNGASCAAYDGTRGAESSWTTGDGFARATSASIDGSSFPGASSTSTETDDLRERYEDALDVIAGQREELERSRRDLIETQRRLDVFIENERERSARARVPPRGTRTFESLLSKYESALRARDDEIRSLKNDIDAMRRMMTYRKRDCGHSTAEREIERMREKRRRVNEDLRSMIDGF